MFQKMTISCYDAIKKNKILKRQKIDLIYIHLCLGEAVHITAAALIQLKSIYLFKMMKLLV